MHHVTLAVVLMRLSGDRGLGGSILRIPCLLRLNFSITRTAEDHVGALSGFVHVAVPRFRLKVLYHLCAL